MEDIKETAMAKDTIALEALRAIKSELLLLSKLESKRFQR
jgi:hypothetical protein